MHDESRDTTHTKNPERDPRQEGFRPTAEWPLLPCLQGAQQQRQKQGLHADISQQNMHQSLDHLRPLTDIQVSCAAQSDQIIR
ncbi:hypothetical protein MITS9509_02239 [Synechococcus sp. MIT S9509]|uniref:hypothetical protein n=1 Tax=unclassified Synechococcus TaxID=2626047 RepID=UPI0007BBEEA7|nr:MULTISPECIES: hypothetical protein [unclassified Synechococcus]KZR86142.1 hypothetical protein MITS9504_01548 [Synechococcus sp. MIT S9504]KZR91603.1 hypothetical protein MITS9509_02239 [Synechococcus sp. MIT S9509]